MKKDAPTTSGDGDAGENSRKKIHD